MHWVRKGIPMWFWLIVIFSLSFPQVSLAQAFIRGGSSFSFRGRSSNGIGYISFTSHRFDLNQNDCFPSGCGGISGPFRNKYPRKELDKPACYYDQQSALFYEREGKVCSYKYVDANLQRVALRKRQWLVQQHKNWIEHGSRTTNLQRSAARHVGWKSRKHARWIQKGISDGSIIAYEGIR